jgi:alkaline phosphatase
MKFSILTSAIIAALLLTGCNDDSTNDTTNNSAPDGANTPLEKLYAVERSAEQKQAISSWFNAGEEELAQAVNMYAAAPSGAQNTPMPLSAAVDKQAIMQRINAGTAKNVILFVGDGMGISTVTAARILEGQNQGHSGEENMLSFDKFPFTALAKTYNTDQQTPDSAGTMTAMMTGVKSDAGVLGVAEGVVRGDCASAQGQELVSALTLAELAGKATGIISTARITHATPAATYAHSPERDWETDYYINEDGESDKGCIDIAQQLVDYNYGNGIEVVLGGGRRNFLDGDGAGNRTADGYRTDGQDLTQTWLNKDAADQRRYVTTKGDLNNVDIANTDKLLGLFSNSHMSYEADRADTEQPSLTDMTTKALAMLTKPEHDKGFFLMVEGGRIDHAHHAGNAYRALTETIEFSNAIKAAVNAVDLAETLIIVTADHSHVFTIAGYPTRGNPILGKVIGNDSTGAANTTPSLDENDMPYTTVGYTNGEGARLDDAVLAKNSAGRTDLTAIDTHYKNFSQEALIPLGSETHAGDDVGIYAIGPWSHLLQGTLEQNMLFHVMDKAAQLTSKAQAAEDAKS